MANNEKRPAFVKRDSIVSDKGYAQLLGRLKDRFRRSQIKAAVKVNTTLLEFYWAMGREISELYKSAKYGSAFFDCLSLDLKAEFPNQTGFSATNIKYAKRWYEFYNQTNPNRQQVADDLEMPLDFGPLGVAEYKLTERLNNMLPSETQLKEIINTYHPDTD